MNIYAIIITFNPSLDSFSKNLLSIQEQVQKVIVVDNSNDATIQNELKEYLSTVEKVDLIQPKENLGIAYAQNIGFVHALKTGANYVW